MDKAFPSNKAEALTMLYLYKNATAGMSPEELAKEYLKIYKVINDTLKAERSKPQT